jgi:large subunit ribosomal protein L13
LHSFLNTATMKSYLAQKGDIQPKWYVVDATNQVLGRLAVKIANVLRGRHRPTYTPHTDTGDYVVVINAGKVAVTGKKEELKTYMFYSGFKGREKRFTLRQFRARKPQFIIMHAVKGMLPKNRLADQMLKKLKVYPGPSHPHAAQKVVPLAN